MLARCREQNSHNLLPRPFDILLCVHFEHTGLLGTVGEDGDLQVTDRFHVISPSIPLRRMINDAGAGKDAIFPVGAEGNVSP